VVAAVKNSTARPLVGGPARSMIAGSVTVKPPAGAGASWG